jgi:hypothetical protein
MNPAREDTHMKKMALVIPPLFLAMGFLLETNTQAVAATEVKGTIKVAGISEPGKCEDLEALVSSQELTKPPLGGPAWQRHAKATGIWAGGLCSYAVTVVPNSAFDVVVEPDVLCSVGYYVLSTTPAQTGWFKLSSGETKDQNFTVDSIKCQIPPK